MFSTGAIHPVNFIQAMSTALEMSSKGISSHHCRTAIIVKHIGEELNLTQNDMQVLIYASLLHDIGAAANWDEKHNIVHVDKDESIFNHAEAGYNLLKDSAQLSPLSSAIRHHHDRFNGGNPSGLSGYDIPLVSRIIHVADRIEVSIMSDCHIFPQREKIIVAIRDNSFFDPEIVDVVSGFALKDYFWLDIVNPSYQSRFLRGLDYFGKLKFSAHDIEQIAHIFANVVDATSSYTATHSKNVARIAELLAHMYGFSEEEQQLFRMAGLLHDIGKLSIPNEILDKPGNLNFAEASIVVQHPYYTLRVLEQIEGFDMLAIWASRHHEKLNGAGYPSKSPAGISAWGAA
ncbi:MAG: HD domain-containing protein [Sporomusaceae bacterium]|nr:HD domain-containing protein [Sporomusaceae bacterium]